MHGFIIKTRRGHRFGRKGNYSVLDPRAHEPVKDKPEKFYCPKHQYNPPENSGLSICPQCEAESQAGPLPAPEKRHWPDTMTRPVLTVEPAKQQLRPTKEA